MKYETPFDLPLDDYKGLIERNEYWDDSGDEANWLIMDKKLIRTGQFIGGTIAIACGRERGILPHNS